MRIVHNTIRGHMNRAIKIAILQKFDTQADFAQSLGVHESKLSQVIRGRRKLSLREAKTWCKVLGCDFSLLRSVTKVDHSNRLIRGKQ